jgi:cytochrome c
MERDMKSIIGSVIAVAGLMVAGGVMAAETMPELAKKLSCNSCHAIDVKLIGPSWRDVAKKYKAATKYTYKDKEYPLVEGLVTKVSKGGSGNWGAMPMPAFDPAGVKQAEITELIKFIQNLPAK